MAYSPWPPWREAKTRSLDFPYVESRHELHGDQPHEAMALRAPGVCRGGESNEIVSSSTAGTRSSVAMVVGWALLDRGC
jgi:hypothetical protein